MTGLTPGTLDTAFSALPYVRRGPAVGPQLLIVQPLFEERNRLRRLLAAVVRDLADRGVGSWVFDLPATGESSLPTQHATWQAWQGSLEVVSQYIATNLGNELHILSVRGGALLDAVPARSLYRLAPVTGERVLRELLRTRIAGTDGETMGGLEARIAAGETLDLAGYAVPAALAQALRAAALPEPLAPLRTAVIGDGAADKLLAGPRLWRQAEPDANLELAAELAADVAEWIAQCAR